MPAGLATLGDKHVDARPNGRFGFGDCRDLVDRQRTGLRARSTTSSGSPRKNVKTGTRSARQASNTFPVDVGDDEIDPERPIRLGPDSPDLRDGFVGRAVQAA